MKVAAVPSRFWRALVPSLTMAVAGGAVPLFAQDGRSAILGIVVDAKSFQPLDSARVQLVGVGLGPNREDLVRIKVTGPDGRFSFDSLPAGTYEISAMHGIEIARPSFYELRPRERIEIEFSVGEREFQLLPEVGVTAEPMLELPKEFRGRDEFRERMNRGFGQYTTRQEIQQRNAMTTPDLLRGFRGIQIVCFGLICSPRSIRSPAECLSTVYLDGQIIDPLILNNVMPSTIEGIEVYLGLADTPLQFVRDVRQARCGAILIWTRFGEPKIRR